MTGKNKQASKQLLTSCLAETLWVFPGCVSDLALVWTVLCLLPELLCRQGSEGQGPRGHSPAVALVRHSVSVHPECERPLPMRINRGSSYSVTAMVIGIVFNSENCFPASCSRRPSQPKRGKLGLLFTSKCVHVCC